MAKPTGGDILVESLIQWDVDTVFGLPGDGAGSLLTYCSCRCLRLTNLTNRSSIASSPDRSIRKHAAYREGRCADWR